MRPRPAATRRRTAAAFVLAFAAAACTSTAGQQPGALGTQAASSPAAASTSPTTAGLDPSSITVPAGLAVTWTYTPTGNSAQDSAVRTAQAFERAVDAGIASANPQVVDFTRLATGTALAWQKQVFASYRQYHETWTGTVAYDRVKAPTATATQVIVQYCQNERAFFNRRADGTVLRTTPSPKDFYLITASLTPAPGGRWLVNTRTAQDGAASCQPGN